MSPGSASPLRRIPDNIEGKWAALRTSLFYATEAMDLSLRRLGSTLLKHSGSDSEGPPPDLLPLLFLDAWAVIDNSNKCRDLLGRLRSDPAIEFSSDEDDELSRLLDDLQSVGTLRNVNQHAADLSDVHQSTGQSPIGSLTWAIASREGDELKVFTAYAGPIPDGSWPGAFSLDELAADANSLGSEVVLTAVHSQKRANQGDRDTWTGRAVTRGAISVGLGATGRKVAECVALLEGALLRTDTTDNARTANATITLKFRRSEPADEEE